MRYFDVEALLRIAASAIEPQEVQVREWGLLSASSARPQTVAFGYEPYPTVPEKAGALLVSLALNHCLVDGNKRLALASMLAFCWVNTRRLPEMSNDEAYNMVIAVCEHKIDVPEVAKMLREAGIPDEELTIGEQLRQEIESDVDAEIAAGQVTRYDNVEDFQASLDVESD